MTIRVSVVVPTYRRPALLERCLKALLQQCLDPCSFEILVVDDGADAATRQVVERFAGRPQPEYRYVGQRNGRANGHGPGASRGDSLPAVRYLALTGHSHGPAAARNAGWRAAGGKIVAFTDDDCIPAPGWLQAGVEAISRGAFGVSGKLVVPVPSSPTDYENNAACLEGARFVTANCFYHRDALEAVGGFDERFTMAWREDSDLYFRLLKFHGDPASFVVAPDAVVVHPVRPGRWGISLHQQRHSIFNALLYKKHPTLYRRLIQPSPPWNYYATVGSLLAIMASILGRQRKMASLALLLWSLLTARFCAQRLRGTSRDPSHVAEMVVTSILIPPLAIYWRLRGAFRFRVLFL